MYPVSISSRRKLLLLAKPEVFSGIFAFKLSVITSENWKLFRFSTYCACSGWLLCALCGIKWFGKGFHGFSVFRCWLLVISVPFEAKFFHASISAINNNYISNNQIKNYSVRHYFFCGISLSFFVRFAFPYTHPSIRMSLYVRNDSCMVVECMDYFCDGVAKYEKESTKKQHNAIESIWAKRANRWKILHHRIIKKRKGKDFTAFFVFHP